MRSCSFQVSFTLETFIVDFPIGNHAAYGWQVKQSKDLLHPELLFT